MRRPVVAARNDLSRLHPIKADIDPAPKPWPFAPVLALIAVMAFLSLQFFLPATHYRDPRDPHRVWIPLQQSSGSDPKMDVSTLSSHLETDAETFKVMHIFCRIDEPDLRPLAVIINSTISNAMFPDNISFHFVVPKILSTSGFFKLKSFFPSVSIDMINDHSFLETMQKSMNWTASEKDKQLLNMLDFLPFYVPKMYPNIEKFVYLDTSSMVQGSIADLFKINMEGYAVAAVEDCSYYFSDLYDLKLLEIIRGSKDDRKSPMPEHPFDPKACSFDQAVLVVDAKNWIGQNLTEAIEWWIKESSNRNHHLYRSDLSEPPVLLALYRNYKKLDASWSVQDLHAVQKTDAKIIHFAKERRPWQTEKLSRLSHKISGLWWDYLSPIANAMLKPV